MDRELIGKSDTKDLLIQSSVKIQASKVWERLRAGKVMKVFVSFSTSIRTEGRME